MMSTSALALQTPLGSRAGNSKMVAINSKTEFCYGLPGAIAPAGEFDPANLLDGASQETVYRWREAELTHGRVGMLASLGFLVQENFHPLFDGIGIPESLRIQKGWRTRTTARSARRTSSSS